ncbi:hypothetical protein Q2K19_04925 [Micromonospora soli]|uniref:hypothetical protein n=1 Tax=Micromonospora sp. NBRC 110009 TaxID=3061627 RepID=UPI002671CFF9|nr:hypothetical protein [Micromonospora sp. NBRC 110009]WKT99837.1 hypothetical protein Q2K19_04925 [Micromonospora sp. NBRC 110009]
MAEDELTQTGIRVGRWLPAVPGERAPDRQPPGGPRRLPSDPDDPSTPPPDVAPLADHVDPASTAEPPAHIPPVHPGDSLPAPPAGDPGPDRSPSARPDRARDAGPTPAGPAAAPARHASREGLAERLAGLVGPAATTVRVAVGVTPDRRATRVGAARARRRRRRVLLAVVALAASAVVPVLAYVGRAPDAGGRAAPGAPPTTSVSPPAPVAAPPTVVPVTGNPAFPGGPLLSLDQEQIPKLVDLTALGVRDWIHWGGSGGDSLQRKQTSTGEIHDPGGERLEHRASASAFAWTDGTPVARQDGIRYGVFQRGAGKSFSVTVAGSGDLRTVRLFVGAFSAAARLDVRLSAGGDPAVREVPLAAGDRFFEYVIQFRAPHGAQLLVTWRSLSIVGGENDGVTLEAVAVS